MAARADLSAEEKRVYPLIDGARTLAEIIDQARLGEFECHLSLFRLFSLGVARLRNVPAPARQAAS